MNFGSDNFAGAHPDIAANLSAHATGYAVPYGTSNFDQAVQQRLGEVFERPLTAFYVATGTAANSLALTSVAKPGGVVLAHHEAHIIVDECGAPEYLSGQLRMVPVDGPDGKMDIAALRRQAERIARLDVHGGRLSAISVTQPTESGTVYSLEELDAISAIAKQYNVPLHMDGARFANGLVSVGCRPADMTWKRGVDILSFGGTKNGCWCAEAVILFDPAKAHEFSFIQKRAAQLFSKSRFVSAQFEAYLRDELWLKLALHANRTAADLAAVLDRSGSARLLRRPQTNEVFAVLKKRLVEELELAQVVFSEWPVSPDLRLSNDEQLCRFVTSFATRDEDLTRFGDLIN
ncbi:unnamed protein product [Clonostachys chloroleuca]|uniref:Aromatic amino acid beta-eliminating lyase/threonine aldolase domain-containing protein n=1 Tax=Clonostachys chloroleuca TaxID=1926264 RepID=A0AA35MID2_9HYPO|nr:unnamed protein product [Clonostachys chloroleuca]